MAKYRIKKRPGDNAGLPSTKKPKCSQLGEDEECEADVKSTADKCSVRTDWDKSGNLCSGDQNFGLLNMDSIWCVFTRDVCDYLSTTSHGRTVPVRKGPGDNIRLLEITEQTSNVLQFIQAQHKQYSMTLEEFWSAYKQTAPGHRFNQIVPSHLTNADFSERLSFIHEHFSLDLKELYTYNCDITCSSYNPFNLPRDQYENVHNKLTQQIMYLNQHLHMLNHKCRTPTDEKEKEM